MKRLGLLRHAKSDWDDMSRRDFDRGLNKRGRKGAALMGRHIRERGDRWDVVVASPAERVRLTLEASGLDLPIEWEQSIYLADPGTLLHLVHGLGDAHAAVLLAGHNPGLQDLLLMLAAPDAGLFAAAEEKFPTASYAVIEFAVDHWAECSPGRGTLTHFARPRDLDPELGPENR